MREGGRTAGATTPRSGGATPRSRITVLTMNVLNDLQRWPERGRLLVEGLGALRPHVIALQEVNLEVDIAGWLADQLGYTAYVSSGTHHRTDREGLAILSRLPADCHDALAFGKQGRIAQRLTVRDGDVEWTVANAHLHWSIRDDRARHAQARKLLRWLPDDRSPTVVCGDFNARPGFRAVGAMSGRFTSAQTAHFGYERHPTFPTGLDRGPGIKNRLREMGVQVTGRMLGLPEGRWQSTLDYIFIDHQTDVLSVTPALGSAAPDDPTLYASDHVGLAADLVWPAVPRSRSPVAARTQPPPSGSPSGA